MWGTIRGSGQRLTVGFRSLIFDPIWPRTITYIRAYPVWAWIFNHNGASTRTILWTLSWTGSNAWASAVRAWAWPTSAWASHWAFYWAWVGPRTRYILTRRRARAIDPLTHLWRFKWQMERSNSLSEPSSWGADLSVFRKRPVLSSLWMQHRVILLLTEKDSFRVPVR